MCSHQIESGDGINNLLLQISGDQKVASSLHYIYYFPLDYRGINKHKETQLASNTLNSFKKFKLQINGIYYTGILKLAVPFNNAGLSVRYSGFDLWVLEYSDGRMVKSEILSDVDIISEEPLSRPN